MTYEGGKKFPNAYGYYTAYSSDGIHWSPNPKPVITREDDPSVSDCHTCMYDPLRNRYIAFTKRHILCPQGRGDQGVILRVRGISFSEDFENWTKPRTVFLPDEFDDRSVQLYNMSGFIYEGMYIGLLEVYYSADDYPAGKIRTDEVQLICSRDGEHWFRAGNRQPFILPSYDVNQWDVFWISINSSGPVDMGGELWIYYGGGRRHHVPVGTRFPEDRLERAIGLATLRKDGFISYNADDTEGTLITRPILFEDGKHLYINADIRGYLQCEVCPVEIVDAPPAEMSWMFKTSKPANGFSKEDSDIVEGDKLDHIITWKGRGVEQFKDRLIVLKFYLRDTSLYSFWVE